MIETERLILRQIDPDRDFDGWARTMGDESTMRYMGGATLDRPNAWRNMAAVIGHWSIRGYGFFSLEEKATGDWVGRVGPWYPEGWPEPEVGWTIAPDHRRKGYATEAGRAAIDYVFNTLRWSRVIHAIAPGNDGSIAVAERLGSTLERQQQGLGGVTEELTLIYSQENPIR